MSKAKTVKEGDVIENYQGKFAKVVSVKDGMYNVTAFHNKKETAEADDQVNRHLNQFGLDQVTGKFGDVGDNSTELSRTVKEENKNLAKRDDEVAKQAREAEEKMEN